jgi:hypothetical protein
MDKFKEMKSSYKSSVIKSPINFSDKEYSEIFGPLTPYEESKFPKEQLKAKYNNFESLSN